MCVMSCGAIADDTPQLQKSWGDREGGHAGHRVGVVAGRDVLDLRADGGNGSVDHPRRVSIDIECRGSPRDAGAVAISP